MKVSLILIFALAGLPNIARASFHLYDIREVYSNSDGSVQFIELFTTSGGQQFLGGHSVTFESGGATQQTLSLSNLPSDSANKPVLLGTANLATLYGVTPNFIIPANFFSAGANNFINFAEGTDRVNLGLLPGNGTSSLDGLIGNSGQTSAATAINMLATPTNFTGQTTVIPEPGTAALGLLTLGATALGRKRD